MSASRDDASFLRDHDDYFDDDDDDSILSACLSAATLSSNTSPIKSRQELLHDRLTLAESHLQELQEHKARHRDVEVAYALARDEIFFGGGGGSGGCGGGRRMRRRQQRTPRQLRLSNRLAAPKRFRGKIRTDGIAKSSHDWIVLRAMETPGVHPDRVVGSTLDRRGGRFNMSHPLTELEVKLLRAREESPDGPNLLLPSTLNPRGMGRFSTSRKPPSEVDLAVLRARQTPGPSDHSVVSSHSGGSGRGGGVKFNESKSKRHVDHVVHLATVNRAQSDRTLTLPSTLSRAGGTFNRSAKPLTERDWIVKRAALTPGPGQYKAKAMDIADVGGGRISATSVLSDTDALLREKKDLPGPADYRVAEAMEASSQHKGAGKAGKFPFVFRPLDFESRHLAKGGGPAEKAAWERRRRLVFKENPDGSPLKPKEKLRRAGNLIKNALRGLKVVQQQQGGGDRSDRSDGSSDGGALGRSALLRAIISGEASSGGAGAAGGGEGRAPRAGGLGAMAMSMSPLMKSSAFSFGDIAKNAMDVATFDALRGGLG